MIEPLQENLLKLLLDGIHQDRLGNGQHNNNDVIRGVIQSFVSVQEYKKKGNLEVEIFFNNILLGNNYFVLIIIEYNNHLCK